MPVITVFGGAYCNKKDIIKNIREATGYKTISDKNVVARACKLSNLPQSKVFGAFGAKTSVFNKFTHEKERSIAQLKLALSQMLSEDNLLINGYCSQLIPQDISHVLRICLIAEMNFRTSLAVKEEGVSEKEAVSLIHNQDKDQSAWVLKLYKNNDPWDPSLYDIVIPTDKTTIDEAAQIIKENLASEVIKATENSKKAALDFVLASQIEVALANEGHNVEVRTRDGSVTLTINKQVLMLSRLEDELKAIVGRVPGVKNIETRVGKGFYQTDIYRKYDFELPSKVLLVDDEREFVQTLSERLQMRDMGSAVAYDGESALNLVNEDDPDVMILDLKMPGIDGIEVLKKVKKTRPEIEVIILTGHGSEKDKDICMKLGAFAYLQKPVNIDLLSDTLKKANEKIKQNMMSKK